MSYVGRFAPSPTGPLHFGSLVAALCSYLDARVHQGRWLVRIEDLDPPREDPNAADQILRLLDYAQLHWDGEVRYQSTRHEAYQQSLNQLIQTGLAFPCQCSRKQLNGQPHRGRCECSARQDIAWRFLCPEGIGCFEDRFQGRWCASYQDDLGDFVLKRRDGPWSYQLAVVTDDADQGVTHIVRGIDLIDSTPRQQLLYRALSSPEPCYAHLPVALESNGQKLSKQNLARALTCENVAIAMWWALDSLQQQPPQALLGASCSELLSWALTHWHEEPLHQRTSLPTPSAFLRDQPNAF